MDELLPPVLYDELYNILHSKDYDGNSCPVLIPDTIIFRDGVITAWFFCSSHDSTILRRHRYKINLDLVTKMLGSGVKRSSSVAAVVYTTVPDHNGHNSISVAHMNLADVTSLIHNALSTKFNGVVQKFVPIQPKEIVYQVAWSPAVTRCACKVNKYSIHDARCGAGVKGATWNAAIAHSEEQQVRSGAALNILQATADAVVSHIEQHGASVLHVEPGTLQAVTFYVKITEGMPTILYCDQVVAGDGGIRYSLPCYHWNMMISGYRPALSTALPQELSKGRGVTCPRCQKAVGVDDTGIVSVKSLILDHTGSLLSMVMPGESPRAVQVTSKKKRRPVDQYMSPAERLNLVSLANELLGDTGPKSTPLHPLNPSYRMIKGKVHGATPAAGYGGEMPARTPSPSEPEPAAIPDALKRAFVGLSAEQYELKLREPGFLYGDVRVCLDCAMAVSRQLNDALEVAGK
ncbi:hypothetical protein J8273_6323 [Carpediemonas membranifera]|uniref:Uncharacterized protein n=1 Tax=Carpediemonas membranifera TaxID=201153 RepID=A0A8J6AQW2_9EUKA|nr:hypothetical protein J8273_6323 [Carpediemonas membranifera]|eukprot:KAG9391558.1 hypothetical protein J8273_6323 [Carpediemonas membranifera]